MKGTETTMQPETAPPSPERIFLALTAYQQTEALRAAIALDLFTSVAEGATDVPALAARCQASERGIRILCDYLTVLGFLGKQGEHYSLPPESAAFLNRHSPADLSSVTRFLNSSYIMSAFDNLAETVRQGTTQLGGQGSMDPEHPVWIDFARAMMPMMYPAAEGIASLAGADVAGPLRVLDIAASHGLFGLAFARRNPQAEVTAVDWPNVLEVARENAAAAGVLDRYRLLAGSAFEVDFGTGHDVALITNFLHHFDAATCTQFMKKVYAGLQPGGRAVTLEFVPNADRVTPPFPASFSLTMLASTQAGNAYTFAEFDEMFRAAGFERNELHALPMSPEQVIVSYK